MRSLVCTALVMATGMGTRTMAAAANSEPGLAGLEARLEQAVKTLGPNARPPEYYVEAQGKLHETEALIAADPNSEERPAWESACSSYVVAAELQIQAADAKAKLDQTNAERLAVLTDQGNVLDSIYRMERGNSSSLRADLEEQKRKIAQAREEAEKRFNALNSALIQVRQDARGTIISMSDILFAVGKADLTESLKTSLAKIAGILTIYKDANISVEGHTDNVGTAEFNQKLSEKRAENVMNFLINPGGIDASRLTAIGYGFSKPIADNSTKEGRQKNRRVDLVIMDKTPAP